MQDVDINIHSLDKFKFLSHNSNMMKALPDYTNTGSRSGTELG